MMCYLDMTFCPFWEDCAKASDCRRPLTPEVRERAAAWAKRSGMDRALISTFAGIPDCHTPKTHE